MVTSKGIKKAAKELYRTLSEITEDTDNQWLKDNGKRILCISAECAKTDVLSGLPKGWEAPRVFELAQEVVEQSEGNVNGDSLELVKKFALTFDEYSMLPFALKLNLLRLLQKAITQPENYGTFLSVTVKSLILFNNIDFDSFRSECLEQERLLFSAKDFCESDDETKEVYRKRVSEIAQKYGMSEIETVKKALEFDKTNICDSLFYKNGLFGKPDVSLRLTLYIAVPIILCAAVICGICFLDIPPVLRVLLSVFSFPPLSVLFFDLENRRIMLNVKPRPVMRLKECFSDVKENKTAVTLTVMLPDTVSAKDAINKIEEHYASNRLENGVYVILADLKASKKERASTDTAICAELESGIEKLNEKYGSVFCGIMRKRVKQGREFFGRERKRGAIEDMAEYILSGKEEFLLFINRESLENCNYILTLDADTVPVPRSVIKLIGTLAHPANREYGLVQPRIGSGIKKTTAFARIFDDQSGIDAYAAPAREVYNDLFFSGSFCGKGLISLKAYKERVMGRIEPMTVLSHDLLEGELINTAFASDVTFLDDCPETVMSFDLRRERWTRGDWQLFPWAFSKKLSAVSRWKIIYNCIQSLYIPGIFAVSVSAIFSGRFAYGIWAAALAVLFHPALTDYLNALRFDREKHAFSDTAFRRHNSIKRGIISAAFMPFDAFDNLRAVFLGVWRRITKHNTLKWNTFASSKKGKTAGENYLFFLPQMIIAPIFYALCVLFGRGAFLGLGALAIWLFAPYIAFRLGQKEKNKAAPLLFEEKEALHILTARTVKFFFCALSENEYIMPDNFQENRGYAKRTSPTNLGFGLLSALCGLKAGIYTTSLCAELLFLQTEQIKKLEKYRGHLYNWYDITSKKPLEKYVSSVDSGNFCASLITLKGAEEYMLSPVPFSRSRCDGIADMLLSAADSFDENMQVRLREYAEKFRLTSGREAFETAKAFLCDGVVADRVPFEKNIIFHHAEEYRELSFSDKLLDMLDIKKDENLRPVRELIESFPMNVKETIACKDFSVRLARCLWQVNPEKAARIEKQAKEEYRKIYARAFAASEKIKSVTEFADGFTENADFECLYNKKKKLLCIGLDAESNKQSDNCYDMLCSEARLTVYLCAALNKIPVETWFNMSRPFSRYLENPICLSWSGTMFEYFMPDLFIKPPEGAMLEQSCSLALQAQKNAKSKSGVWGMSESAFNALDLSGEYKYRAFGAENTAVSRFREEKVFSPYSTLLALESDPRGCTDNIIRLVGLGCAGEYGMYEAVDFARFEGSQPGVVYSFMAHHSGMGLCALINFLYSGFVRKCFTSDRRISAVKVLLEEKMPAGVLPIKQKSESEKPKIQRGEYVREFMAPQIQQEEVLFIPSGQMTVRASSRGDIKVYYKNKLAGEVFVYIQDEKISSAGFLPVGDTAGKYRCEFRPGSAKYVCMRESGSNTLEVFASGESAVIRVNCESAKTKNKRVAAVFIPVLNDEKAYLSHPAFNGLFTECGKIHWGVRFRNRKTEESINVYSLSETENVATDSLNVFGRGKGTERPNLEGKFMRYPINPCGALYVSKTVQSGETEEFDFVISPFNAVKTKAAVNLYFSRCKNDAAALADAYELSPVLWKNAQKLNALAQNDGKASSGEAKKDALWKYGISDEKPVLLIKADENCAGLNENLKMCTYCLACGADFNIIVAQDTVKDYMLREYNSCEEIISSFGARERIFHITGVKKEELELLKHICFAFVDSSLETGEQLRRPGRQTVSEITLKSEKNYPPSKCDMPDGEFDNGFGRFLKNGYYIYSRTPAPWSNVVSNGRMGFLRTESGGGYSWYQNSALCKITPWSNDPVKDKCGEILYLKDKSSGRFWTVTRDPVDYGDGHEAFFGHGFVVFGYNGFGIRQKQTEFVHSELPIKIISLELDGIRDREMEYCYFLDPVLGEMQAGKLLDAFMLDGCVCVRREGKYLLVYSKDAKYYSDKQGFLGLGTASEPDALKSESVSLDTCAGDSIVLFGQAKEKTDIFILCGDSIEEILMLKKTAENLSAEAELEKVKSFWHEKCTKVQISTPDKKLDTLFNGWLIYQVYACRMLARCGFYQAGGAYGFRDQLQDCLAVMYVDPEKVRKHILLCAAHQFFEGDVQHWWHEPAAGVRTRISDDLLFLPFVAARYASVTGDTDIFSETVPYLEGHSLAGKSDLYESAWQSEKSGTLKEHCIKAIKLVISRSGKHSLPLILGGDWNDGMNRIGEKSRGESVWLGWFLYHTISVFLPYAGDDAEMLKEHAKKLCAALNTVCWDGQWYIRAFSDNGDIIGSSKSEECQIDAISQSWAVLSGAGKPEMIRKALKSAEDMLIDKKSGIVKLLTPPFDKSAGYIGDYIPGVRENGGQYTHGAVWLASAFAQSGDGEKCCSVLNMLSPITHSIDKMRAENYMLEPYVMPADVYSNEENVGRGGWSWYTGSASMYFCAVLSDLLGIKKEGKNITVEPHIPFSWQEYRVKLGDTEIKVLNPERKTEGVSSILKNEEKNEIRAVM